MSLPTVRTVGLMVVALAALALPLGVTLPYFQHLVIFSIN